MRLLHVGPNSACGANRVVEANSLFGPNCVIEPLDTVAAEPKRLLDTREHDRPAR